MSNTQKFFEALANDEAMQERAAASTAGLFDFAKSEGYDIAQGDFEQFAKTAPAAVGDDELEEITGGASVGFKIPFNPNLYNTQLLYQNKKGAYAVTAKKVGDEHRILWVNKSKPSESILFPWKVDYEFDWKEATATPLKNLI